MTKHRSMPFKKSKDNERDDFGDDVETPVASSSDDSHIVYKIIDKDMFTIGTNIYNMIVDIESIIDDNKKYGENIPIDWITKKLHQTKYSHLSLDSIRGTL